MDDETINEENKRYMIFNLNEAKEEIDSIIKELEEDPECSDGNLQVGFAHLYHHINFAWNIRHLDNEKQDRVSFLTDDEFHEWSQFPQDIIDLLP